MKKAFFAGVAGLVLCAGLRVPAAKAGGPFKVIVNPSVVGKTIPRQVVAQIYLGGVQRWGDGQLITAVDLSSTSPVRGAFSADVLTMSIEAVKAHWVRSISAGGKRPPKTRQTDEDVIAFVASEVGSIGYVSEATPVPPTVRAVTVQ